MGSALVDDDEPGVFPGKGANAAHDLRQEGGLATALRPDCHKVRLTRRIPGQRIEVAPADTPGDLAGGHALLSREGGRSKHGGQHLELWNWVSRSMHAADVGDILVGGAS